MIAHLEPIGGLARLWLAVWHPVKPVNEVLCMKIDSSFPPFNTDAFPLWVRPDLFDETKEIAHRGWLIVGLYLASLLLNGLIICGPLAIYMAFGGFHGVVVSLSIWLIIFFPGGLVIGLAVRREFNMRVKKMEGSR